MRLRDSQCGLFATGKVLRRFQVPFTYMTNCRLTDPEFERGVKDFLAVCNVVKVFRHPRILQIAPPAFRLLVHHVQRGGAAGEIQHPVVAHPPAGAHRPGEAGQGGGHRSQGRDGLLQGKDECLRHRGAAGKHRRPEGAMRRLADQYGCNAVAIQCWNALQGELGIMPCAANSLLNEEGLPVVCETDIHGAITAVMAEAADLNRTPSFFADWTVRHPDNENGELLQHCGPWPLSCAGEKPTIGMPLAFDYPGAVAAEAKHGLVTLCRFDGDNGEYSLLLGTAKGIDGPYTKGTYLWVEVENWKRLEAKLVEGPYIHHCVGIHKDVVPVLYEACKYLGITPDLYDNNEEQVKAYLRGE